MFPKCFVSFNKFKKYTNIDLYLLVHLLKLCYFNLFILVKQIQDNFLEFSEIYNKNRLLIKH